jgi:Rap1a immunity proteins
MVTNHRLRVWSVLGTGIVLALLSAGVKADTGQDWLPRCKQSVAIMDAQYKNYVPGAADCLYYVGGMYQMLRLMQGVGELQNASIRFCVPDNITTGQALRVYVRYMENNPNKLHLDAHVLALMAWVHAFPC